MARGFVRSRVVQRSQKRLTLWGFKTWSEVTMVSEGGTILASLSAAALAQRPFTIIRQHWELQIVSDQAAAIERQYGAFGTCVVSDQASAIGVTAVPTPITDGGSEFWMAHRFYAANESNLTDRTTPATRITIDSKAMRKVSESEDHLLVAELDNAGAGQIIAVAGRVLFKLH